MSAIEAGYNSHVLEGVRRKRVLAFVIDFTIVSLISLALGVVVFFLGVFTFGLAWALYGSIFPIVAILYTGLGVADEHQATPGMRMAGLVFRLDNGEPPGFAHGAAHVILFYLSVTFLTPLVLVVTLLNGRKRLLHDILVGATVENR